VHCSGLDAFNAFNVIESWVSLARNYNRTVIFIIHQPRSNIVALFDQLVVLAMGKLVYSGEFSKCQGYCQAVGRPCPPGFNIADYLSSFSAGSYRDFETDYIVDLTVNASMYSGASAATTYDTPPSDDTTNLGDEELGFTSGIVSIGSRTSSSSNTEETEL
jgi:ABC-type multidrug transport system ATPase subunit